MFRMQCVASSHQNLLKGSGPTTLNPKGLQSSWACCHTFTDLSAPEAPVTKSCTSYISGLPEAWKQEIAGCKNVFLVVDYSLRQSKNFKLLGLYVLVFIVKFIFFF